MKIKEFAESQNVSTNGVYKAILREGYSTKELTDKRGNITAAGFKILRRIYPEKVAEDVQPEKESGGEDAELLRKLTEAEKERDILKAENIGIREQLAAEKAQVEKWQQLYIDLQESAKQERERLDLLLSREQENHRLSLMSPLKRLFAGRKAKTIATEAEIK